MKARLWEDAERARRRPRARRSQPGADGARRARLHAARAALRSRARCRASATRAPRATPSRCRCARRSARRRSCTPVAALVLRGGKALAVRRPATGLLGGLWELPGGETPARAPRPRNGSRRAARARRGSPSKASSGSATSSTSSRIGRCACACSLAPQRLAACASTAGTATAGSHPADFDRVPCGNLTKKVLALTPHGGRPR